MKPQELKEFASDADNILHQIEYMRQERDTAEKEYLRRKKKDEMNPDILELWECSFKMKEAILKTLESGIKFQDIEIDGIIFCGKCGERTNN